MSMLSLEDGVIKFEVTCDPETLGRFKKESDELDAEIARRIAAREAREREAERKMSFWR